MGHKVPDTSKAAHKQAKAELVEKHRAKIIAALGKIGISNYEGIAAAAKMDKIACMRRLSELEADQVIYKPGSKSLTRSGRQAYNYCLTESHTLKVEHPVTPLIEKTKEAKELLKQTSMF